MSLNITVKVTRQVPNTAVLTNLYDFINATFQDSDLFYNSDEVEELKKNPNNIFLNQERKIK
jgi:hypothetical protein